MRNLALGYQKTSEYDETLLDIRTHKIFFKIENVVPSGALVVVSL